MLFTWQQLNAKNNMTNRESYRLQEDMPSKSVKKECEDDHTLKEKIKDLGNDFASRTTAHGWGRVAWAKVKTVKVVWLAVTLGALVACAVHISLLITQYLRFYSEVKWKVSLSEIAFPSVSICNIQPMSESTAKVLFSDPDSQFAKWYNITHNLDVFQIAADALNKSSEFEIVQNRMKQPIGYYENIGNESIVVGHQENDLILDCSYGHYNCDSLVNFTFFQSATYFNCYTYNGEKRAVPLTAKSSGPHEGLSMILYLENDSGNEVMDTTYHTLSNVGNAAGARVVVHPPGTRPSPLDQGFDVPPGFSANIGLGVLNFIRLDHPFGECTSVGDKDTANYVYSSHSCLLLCQQDHVINSCSCVSSLLPQSTPQKEKRLNYCAYWDVEADDPLKDLSKYFDRILCESNALQQFSLDDTIKNECKCDPLCTEYSYNTHMSYSSWPLDFTQSDFFEKYVVQHENASQLKAYKNLGKYNSSELISKGLIKSNFLRINVYLQSMSIEEYDEKQSYELANLFSDIGGTCGLWVGMSIITWCEFMELVVLFLHKIINYMSTK